MRAAIDIGTNSFHMVVARVDGDDRFEVIDREKEMVRLGSGSGDMKLLEPEAIDRGVAALSRLAPHRRGLGAAAAGGGDERRARGRERRRVPAAGVGRGRHRGRCRLRCRGGPAHPPRGAPGAAGVRAAHARHRHRRREHRDRRRAAGELLAAKSHKLGAIRLTRRFFEADRLHPGAVDAARRHIRGSLVPIAREVEVLGFDVAVGTSGTIGSVAAMVQAARGEDPPRTFNGWDAPPPRCARW